MNRDGKARMHVEPLHDGRRDDGHAIHLTGEESKVVNRLFTADAFKPAFKGEVNGKTLEIAQGGRALVERDARKLARADARVSNRSDLRAREEIEAVITEVFVDENLRALFRRDGLLNRIREDLTEGQVRRDVDVGGGEKAVREIMHAFHVKAGPALIRVVRTLFRAEDAILDGVETEVEIGARIGARPHV